MAALRAASGRRKQRLEGQGNQHDSASLKCSAYRIALRVHILDQVSEVDGGGAWLNDGVGQTEAGTSHDLVEGLLALAAGNSRALPRPIASSSLVAELVCAGRIAVQRVGPRLDLPSSAVALSDERDAVCSPVLTGTGTLLGLSGVGSNKTVEDVPQRQRGRWLHKETRRSQERGWRHWSN